MHHNGFTGDSVTGIAGLIGHSKTEDQGIILCYAFFEEVISQPESDLSMVLIREFRQGGTQGVGLFLRRR